MIESRYTQYFLIYIQSFYFHGRHFIVDFFKIFYRGFFFKTMGNEFSMNSAATANKFK